MLLSQFQNSIQNILKNTHIDRGKAIYRHIQWQFRKVLNKFPFEQKISNSRIIAKHKRCGVSALINSHGLYDFNNMNLLKILLQPGGVFFDIGANIGSYSLIASEQPDSQVYTFEPHPVTFDMLLENIELNNRYNVKLFNIALGNQNDRAFLTNIAGSSINHIEPESRENTVSIIMKRADLFCKENGVIPKVVKIDVEGFEYDVLTGFGEYLKEVRLLFIEMNGLSDFRSSGGDSIKKLLKANDFSGPYYFNYDLSALNKEPNNEDCIFASNSFLKEIPVRVMNQK
jgi:FkbM family methyltransferase